MRGEDTEASPGPFCLVDDERTEPALGLPDFGLVVAVRGRVVPAFTAPPVRLVRLVADLLAAVLVGLEAVRAAVLDGRAAELDLRAAEPDVRADVRADVPEALRAVPDGRAADRDREAAPDDLLADRDRVVLDDLVADRDLEAGRDAADALGAVLACDMVFAAAVSDLAAVVMALVAVFIACMAVDIVLAEDVALVAAAVILDAAEVTFVAADETVRAAVAVDGVLAEPVERAERVERVVRVALAPPLLLLVLLALRGLLAARAGVLLLVDLVRALAGVRRAVVRVVVRAGTDLPPSRSITGLLFHQQHRFTHAIAAYLQNNGRKQTKIAANSPRHVAPQPAITAVARPKTTSAYAGAGQAVTGHVAPPSLPGSCPSPAARTCAGTRSRTVNAGSAGPGGARPTVTTGTRHATQDPWVPPTTPALRVVPRCADSSADRSRGQPFPPVRCLPRPG